jgi:hypothetical protein
MRGQVLLLLQRWLWSDSLPTLDIAGAITPPLALAVAIGLVLVAAGAVASFAAGAVAVELVLVKDAWASGSRVRFWSLQTGSLALGLLLHLLLLLELGVVLVARLLVAVKGFGAGVQEGGGTAELDCGFEEGHGWQMIRGSVGQERLEGSCVCSRGYVLLNEN